MSVFLKKIDKIKGFGSFENFAWPSNLPEFKKYNLIYGRNGSGKTTLSHFLQCYEEKEFPEDFEPTPTMKITTDQGASSDFLALNERIKVFNIYYIEKNLKWHKEEATNLLWLGKEDIEIQDAIKVLDKEVATLELNIPTYEAESALAEKSFNKLLTDHSKIIRQALDYDQGRYKKNNLEKDYEEIIDEKLVATTLNDEDYKKKKALACAATAEDEVEGFLAPELNLGRAVGEVVELLAEKITPTTQIEELMQSPALKKWVEEGLEHHDKSGQCKFCANYLTEERLLKLRGFFDESQRELKKLINDKIAEIGQLKDSVGICMAEEIKITDKYKEEGLVTIQAFNAHKEEINKLLDSLISKLNSKEQDLYSSFEESIEEINVVNWEGFEKGYKELFSNIEEVIQKHNEYIQSFDKNKNEAQRGIELHLALEQKEEYVLRKEANATKKIG